MERDRRKVCCCCVWCVWEGVSTPLYPQLNPECVCQCMSRPTVQKDTNLVAAESKVHAKCIRDLYNASELVHRAQQATTHTVLARLPATVVVEQRKQGEGMNIYYRCVQVRQIQIT